VPKLAVSTYCLVMPDAIVIGSGPAAAAVTLALAARAEVHVTILDVGLCLESRRSEAVEQLSRTEPGSWGQADLDLITEQPAHTSITGLPEKRSFGSDFPFRDVGQLLGVEAGPNTNRSVVSGAYGGFSNVWGSQVMPFTNATFDEWPVSGAEMESHYQAILREIPFSAEADDLAELFPLLSPSLVLPRASERTDYTLERYKTHRSDLQRLGIRIGKARLAFNGPSCVRCGMCMTGCPLGLIYSAAQTFDRLRSASNVSYHPGLLVLKVFEDRDGSVVVTARDLTDGTVQSFRGDRAFIAAGAVGSTRIVANSLHLFDRDIGMGESVQFVLPFVSRRPTSDPRTDPNFTLNQFNLAISLDEVNRDISLLHFYTYNQAFTDGLPALFRNPHADVLLSHALRRISVALGYLPSWASPGIHLRFSPGRDSMSQPETLVSRDKTDWLHNPMLRQVLLRLLKSASRLDLYPVVPKLLFAAGGKSYHFGGSFPHSHSGASLKTSDRLGRVGPWTRVHMVDAAVFPDVAATTFTLTIMANAHRIAQGVLGMEW
jgi:ferredoxin